MKTYDVALSFAGEDRDYVESVAEELTEMDVSVFYDKYEKTSLWGKDLYEHLQQVYQNRAKFTVMFISDDYAQKTWTSHERESAQARALEENREYILPARFDDTEVPGLSPTIGYIDLANVPPSELAEMIKRKLDLSETKTSTSFSELTNQELVAKTFDLVNQIRKLVHKFEMMRADNRNRRFFLRSPQQSEEEREAEWKQGHIEDRRLNLQLKQKFESEYKNDALLLKSELERRLPETPEIPRDRYVSHYYEYISGVGDLRRVIDDLEKLAKSLP